MDEKIPNRLCGRAFDEADLERIRREILGANPPLRAEIPQRSNLQRLKAQGGTRG